MSAVASRLEAAREIVLAPRATVALDGPYAVHFHSAFTARHPRVAVARAKTWGVALLPIPASLDGYLEDPSRRYVRRRRRRAVARGFTVRSFASAEHLDEILEIHRSAPERQGVPMKGSYLKPKALQQWAERFPTSDGAFDRDGHLRANVHAPVVGDVAIMHRLLGHADALEDGVMYLLISEVVGRCVAQRAADGQPGWLMYDTLWGARPGLEEFKRRLGFAPYRVRWELAGA